MAVIHASRNLNLLGHAASMHANATARCTRMFDLNSLSATFLTDHLHGHRSLAVIHEAFTGAGRTFARSSARLAFAAGTRGTQAFALDLDLFLGSFNSIHEIDFHRDINILASLTAVGLLAEISEEILEISKELLFHGTG